MTSVSQYLTFAGESRSSKKFFPFPQHKNNWQSPAILVQASVQKEEMDVSTYE